MSSGEAPLTRYAQSGDLSIAYQAHGAGPPDLVFVPGIINHVEYLHEFPEYVDFLRLLTAFARVVTFDKSGQGLSDRAGGVPSVEQRTDDVRAVMDAVGLRRSAILGCSEGAPISILFAATYPHRVSHLIIFGGFARFTSSPDYPFTFSPEVLESVIASADQLYGSGDSGIRRFLPSSMHRPNAVAQYAKLERLNASPGAYKSMLRQNSLIDIRPILGSIRTPTLILHRRDDAAIGVGNGRYLAEKIPGAQFIEYNDCTDHLIFAGDLRKITGDIKQFIKGESDEGGDDVDRVLATVLFTDIVGSTAKAAEFGDRQWIRILDEHDRIAERVVGRYRGRLVEKTGDGVLATFDGPGRAIRCATALGTELHEKGLGLRAGLHTGEIELRGERVGGLAVHAAARVMAVAASGEVLVSRVVVDLVAGAGIRFSSRGLHQLKGVPGQWELFAAEV